MYKMCKTANIHKVVIKVLQGSVVTQTVLDGLSMYQHYVYSVNSVYRRTLEVWT